MSDFGPGFYLFVTAVGSVLYLLLVFLFLRAAVRGAIEQSGIVGRVEAVNKRLDVIGNLLADQAERKREQ